MYHNDSGCSGCFSFILLCLSICFFVNKCSDNSSSAYNTKYKTEHNSNYSKSTSSYIPYNAGLYRTNYKVQDSTSLSNKKKPKDRTRVITTPVWISLSPNAYAYHKTYSCAANRTKYEVVKVTTTEAREKYVRSPCRICHPR